MLVPMVLLHLVPTQTTATYWGVNMGCSRCVWTVMSSPKFESKLPEWLCIRASQSSLYNPWLAKSSFIFKLVQNGQPSKAIETSISPKASLFTHGVYLLSYSSDLPECIMVAYSYPERWSIVWPMLDSWLAKLPKQMGKSPLCRIDKMRAFFSRVDRWPFKRRNDFSIDLPSLFMLRHCLFYQELSSLPNPEL